MAGWNLNYKKILLRATVFGVVLLAVGQFLFIQKNSRSSLSLQNCQDSLNEIARLKSENEKACLTQNKIEVLLPNKPPQDQKRPPMPLYRDLFVQDTWPGVDISVGLTMGGLPRTVYYLWCGEKQFLFRHYLVLLSSIRILRASKIIFLHDHLPQSDGNLYNTWFDEFKYSVPNFQLLQVSGTCGRKDSLKAVLELLPTEGGIVLGENALIPRLPTGIEHMPLWLALSGEDVSRGVLIVQRGFNNTKSHDYLSDVKSAKSSCVTAEQYTVPVDDIHCIIVDSDVHPRDVWQGQTPFAELARWLYYGRRSPILALPDPSRPIPRIAHYVWLKADPAAADRDLPFSKFLSMISALYVGGFQHVYVHGNVEPEGEWWRLLRSENVTFVRIERPSSMFQMNFPILPANSDLLRAIFLLNYGGAYMDTDAVWTSRVPDWLLQYPVVATFDWPAYNSWPDSFNLGVIMARPQAPWLRHWLSAFRHYRQSHTAFTAIQLPYRVYEHYPTRCTSIPAYR
ncbi:uncharacterized protein LOC112561135 [Pomacea canaliculata]|uniref:uncharacterized protein LOC112561135 n=1 Tax=Pomacea canaliculata TaxID=400727 RepID=UPI000D733AE0|nr:uncharacterized protein LOC112561135 [Pomacea canaliculata]XP_025089205.1 uncharacterized protein LOC112561135 [Pomacea canaliculata]XP_025089206.1 uncharacterized protein LOC112561135 [Pomacea canaliculata]